jgi:hypothetical protein
MASTWFAKQLILRFFIYFMVFCRKNNPNPLETGSRLLDKKDSFEVEAVSGAYKIPRIVLKRLPWLDWACWKANSS